MGFLRRVFPHVHVDFERIEDTDGDGSFEEPCWFCGPPNGRGEMLRGVCHRSCTERSKRSLAPAAR